MTILMNIRYIYCIVTNKISDIQRKSSYGTFYGIQ